MTGQRKDSVAYLLLDLLEVRHVVLVLLASVLLLVVLGVKIECHALILNIVEEVCMGMSLWEVEPLRRMDFGVLLEFSRFIRLRRYEHDHRLYLCFSIKALKLFTPLLNSLCPLTAKR